MAVFLRKHCAEEARTAVWAAYQKTQRRRLVDFMVRGGTMPGDVGRLLRGLRKGYAGGLERKIVALPRIARAPDGFRTFDIGPRQAATVAGRYWRRGAIEREASKLAKSGQSVSAFVFSRTGLFHRVRFHPDGYWEQIGGLFGRSDRSQKIFRIVGFGKRLRQEKQRVARQRMVLDEGIQDDKKDRA
jgi:hypothetical protein